MKGIKYWLYESLILLTFLGILSLIPLILALALVFLTIRSTLGAYKCLFKRDYGNFLTGMSNIFSSDWPYDKPVVTVGGYSFLEGDLDLRDFRAHFSKRLQASPLFPQLKQYLTTWLGFSVWKQDRHFNLDNHVKALDDPETLRRILGNDRFVTEENVLDVVHKFTKLPFPPKTCPWDIHVCHQVKLKDSPGPVTAVIVRVHHTLGDATAMMNLIAIICDSGYNPMDKIIQKLEKGAGKMDRPLGKQILHLMSYPLLGTYELVKSVFESWDSNTWKNFRSPRRSQFNYVNFSVTKATIQEARKVHNVSFFSVVLAAQSAALRRYMIKYSVPVPDTMHATYSIPIPRKDLTLANDLTFVFVTLPVGMNNRNEIVQRINEEQGRLKSSRLPLAVLALMWLYGLLPRKLLMIDSGVTTCAGSNFPGFEENPTVLNRHTLGIGAVAALPATIGVYMWCFGFDDIVSISLGVSPDIMDSRDKVAECARFILEELHALKCSDDAFIMPEVSSSSTGTKTLRTSDLRGT